MSNLNSLFEEFEWRGQVANATEGARELLSREKVTAYIGFDPTASSLHVGTLVPIMALKRLQRFGHAIERLPGVRGRLRRGRELQWLVGGLPCRRLRIEHDRLPLRGRRV